MQTVVQVILTTLLSCSVSMLFWTVRDQLNKRHCQKQNKPPRQTNRDGRRKK